MRSLLRLLGPPLLACVAAPGWPPSADAAPKDGAAGHRALERYVGGQFDAALTQLRDGRPLADAARRLMRDADRWIGAGAEAERPRRRAAVAAMAVELIASTADDT